MNIISVCVIAVFAVICSAALRSYGSEIAGLLTLAAVVMLSLLALPYAQSVIVSITGLSEQAAVRTEYVQALIKSVGICFLTRISADICRENGGQSAASEVELCGRLAILMIACPLYADLISLVGSFLK